MQVTVYKALDFRPIHLAAMLLAVPLHSVGQGLVLPRLSISPPLHQKHLNHLPHLSMQARLHQVLDFLPTLLVVPTLSVVPLRSAVGLVELITMRRQQHHLRQLQRPPMQVTLRLALVFLPRQIPLVAPTLSEIPLLSAAGLLSLRRPHSSIPRPQRQHLSRLQQTPMATPRRAADFRPLPTPLADQTPLGPASATRRLRRRPRHRRPPRPPPLPRPRAPASRRTRLAAIRLVGRTPSARPTPRPRWRPLSSTRRRRRRSARRRKRRRRSARRQRRRRPGARRRRSGRRRLRPRPRRRSARRRRRRRRRPPTPRAARTPRPRAPRAAPTRLAARSRSR
jgi:hypothetical protein